MRELSVAQIAAAVDADTGKAIEVESIPPKPELRRGRDGKLQPAKKSPRKPVTQSDVRAAATELKKEATELAQIVGAEPTEPRSRDEAVVALSNLIKASRKPDDAIEAMIKIAGEARGRISADRARHLVQEFARAFGFSAALTPINKVLH
jgi:hypothetical protein